MRFTFFFSIERNIEDNFTIFVCWITSLFHWTWAWHKSRHLNKHKLTITYNINTLHRMMWLWKMQSIFIAISMFGAFYFIANFQMTICSFDRRNAKKRQHREREKLVIWLLIWILILPYRWSLEYSWIKMSAVRWRNHLFLDLKLFIFVIGQDCPSTERYFNLLKFFIFRLWWRQFHSFSFDVFKMFFFNE